MVKNAVALVGMGEGTGAALARRFAIEGYPVAMLARSSPRLREYENSIPGTRGFTWDANDDMGAAEVFANIREELGPIGTLIYNAAYRRVKTFQDATLEDFESSWGTNTRGLFIATKQVIADMVSAGSGTILVSGATASLRGNPSSVTFAPAKAGARILAQALAREYGPQGIHVATVIIDGAINHALMRRAIPDRPDEFFIEPDDIADAFYKLKMQPRSAWTFELDLRPFGEKW